MCMQAYGAGWAPLAAQGVIGIPHAGRQTRQAGRRVAMSTLRARPDESQAGTPLRLHGHEHDRLHVIGMPPDGPAHLEDARAGLLVA